MDDLTQRPMPWVVPETGDCPVARTLRVIGGKHKPSILHCLMGGEQHFLELTRRLGGISRKVLVEQLRDLEAAGLVTRVQKTDARRRVGYALSDKGRALGEIVSQIYGWAERYPDPVSA